MDRQNELDLTGKIAIITRAKCRVVERNTLGCEPRSTKNDQQYEIGSSQPRSVV